MLHNDIQHPDAQVDQQEEFFGGALRWVRNGEDAADSTGINLADETITLGRGKNIDAPRPQQGNILYDHLPADPETPGQLPARDGFGVFLENLQNCLATVDLSHSCPRSALMIP